jgi:signal transduction histidine kinase
VTNAHTEVVLRPIYLRGNRLIRAATVVHLAIALAIAPVFQTWLVTIPVGLLATAMFWGCAWLAPTHQLTRVVAGISLQAFCALHIYQLHGMPEMHFFFFTSLTLMILYKDWVALWPSSLLIIGQHVLFAALHNSGTQFFFFEEERVSSLKLAFHFGIALADVTIASVVANGLRARTLHDAEQLEASERLRVELQQARDRLVQTEKLATAGQLAAGVGHEINNPLAFVTGNLDYLRTRLKQLRPQLSALPELDELYSSLDDAGEGAARIATIVRDLKTFSRSDNNALGPVDLTTSLEFALSMASPEIRHRAVVERDYGDVPPVTANDTRLGQVFLVLLVNAAQAMTEGGVARNRLRVTTRLDPDGRVRTSVTDTGPGISPEHLTRIFDPFFTTKKLGEGTGLGLSIAYNIVTSLGGQLEAVSPPGQGATFHVVLPAAAGAVRARSGKTPNQTIIASTPVRVLVIDDEPDMGSLITRMLGRSAVVTSALSGRRGLELLEGAEFDLVLCDVMMPDVSGPQVYRAIATKFPRLLPRVVMMTGGAFTSESANFVEGLPTAVLEKPFTTHELASLIELVCTRAA